jgi:glycosyltransferase involved in cell wall biosynthesis
MGNLVKLRTEAGISHELLAATLGGDMSRSMVERVPEAALIGKVAPDAILFACGTPFDGLAAREVAVFLGVPYIVVEGAADPAFAVGRTAFLPKLATLYEHAREVVAFSGKLLEVLRHNFGLANKKGQVLWPGRPERFFDRINHEIRRQLRHELGIAPHQILVLTLARLTAAKGINELLDAASRMSDDKIRFVWAGDGADRERIRQEIIARGLGERFLLLGYRSDIPTLLDAADIFVLSSHEGCPLSIIEAMAKGLPVLASNVGGIPEAMGHTGRLLPSPVTNRDEHIAALVMAINELADDSELRMRIGALAKARAIAHFREERMTSLLAELVKQALFQPGDHLSPNLPLVKLDRHFPFLVGSRQNGGGNRLFDARAPSIPFMDRDEIQFVYANALGLAGREGLVIGTDLGWVGAHLAAAGMKVTLLSPSLAVPDIQAVTVGALRSLSASRANLGRRTDIELYAQGLEGLAEAGRRWSLIVAQEPSMTDMAELAEKHTLNDALVFFPFLGEPSRVNPFEQLRKAGWQVMILRTAGYLGVAWRGNLRPVAHVPASWIPSAPPDHLVGLVIEEG